MDHFDDIGPSVVMASPGMMQSGLSRELFESWCTDKRNGVIIAGYCVEGTLAKVRLQQGGRQSVKICVSNRQIHQVSWIMMDLYASCSTSCQNQRRLPPCQDRSCSWRCQWTTSPSLPTLTTSRPANSSGLSNHHMWSEKEENKRVWLPCV